MRAFLLALPLSTTFLFPASTGTPGEQTAEHFEKVVTKTVKVDYLLSLPMGYDKDGEQKWPLLLFLHGAGERGDDLAQLKRHGPPKLVDQGKELPFVIVSPQCPRGGWWQDDVLLALLDEVMAGHAIDPDRVYLTGLSMGGFGTWSLAAAAPERFAAIAPICGGGSFGQAYRIGGMPVWAFHGVKDKVVPFAESERMVEALRRRGNEQVKFTAYPEAGHDSWTETYANEELYTWLLSHRRTDSKR